MKMTTLLSMTKYRVFMAQNIYNDEECDQLNSGMDNDLSMIPITGHSNCSIVYFSEVVWGTTAGKSL